MKSITKETLALALIKAESAQGRKLDDAQARKIVEAFFSIITDELARGSEVHLSGFGNFKLVDKAARPAQNPKTGMVLTIAPRRVVSFRAGRKLRQMLEYTLFHDSNA